MLRYSAALWSSTLLLACDKPAPHAIVPVDAATTRAVYEAELVELKRLLPKDTSAGAIPWAEHMYLNSSVLLPEADSANPLRHDQQWLNSVLGRGLINGYCGRPPDSPCPDSFPIAFTSLGVPWTRGGDTVFVGGGYTGLVPNQKTSDAVFWLFTVVHSDSGWVVKSKGPPNSMTFTSD